LDRGCRFGIVAVRDQSPTGESFVERVPVVADWLAEHGHPHMRIGLGETSATATSAARRG
jgi:hypothetical protein